MKDLLMKEFHLNTKMHENAILHAHEKGAKLNELNVLMQPQAWDILTESIYENRYSTDITEIHYINKANGMPITYEESLKLPKVREIYVMQKLDRIIWNMFYQIGYKYLAEMIHPLCVSYKKGESTQTTARKINKALINYGNYSVIKGDLSKYFDSVPLWVIDEYLDIFEEKYPSSMWKPIREFYHTDLVKINGETVERYGSLKQGCAFACLLADIILRDIDEAMSKLNVTYYRYSDDFIIIGRKKDVENAFRMFCSMLNNKGMKLNETKTERHNQNNWFTFLGFRFKREKITFSEKAIKNIRMNIKERTINKCKQLKRPLTENEIEKAIDDLQYYFFKGCESHPAGMLTYQFGAINDIHDIQRIDEYCKDCIRACKTNKTELFGLGTSWDDHGIQDIDLEKYPYGKGKNVKANYEKYPELPREKGWYSLVHMYNSYIAGKDIYNMEIRKIDNGYLY